jgi:RsiW-degrading membrane proteinase PrsW (M82 family)
VSEAARSDREHAATLAVVNLELSAVLGLVFGALAAACAFVISYGEYKRNWSFRGSASRMALRSALVTFAFFFLAAMVFGLIIRLVV